METTIDQFFEWKDDLARKTKEFFGCHSVDVSNQTFADMRERCYQIDSKQEAYISRFPEYKPLNSISVHVVEDVPYGIVRGCTCKVSVAGKPLK